jgi:hypothetical protein
MVCNAQEEIKYPFLKSYHPRPSRPKAPVSSVAGGDGTKYINWSFILFQFFADKTGVNFELITDLILGTQINDRHNFFIFKNAL